MAGNLWGADVAQLRTLAQQFGKTSDSLLQQSTQLSNQINNNPAWKGQDAVTFRADWNSSHRALIQRTALALKQESKKLLTQAEQQEKASSGGGDSAGTSGPTGGSTPWGPDWLADSNSPFREGWDNYNGVLGLKTVPFGIRDMTQFAGRYGDEVAEAWRAGDRAGALATIKTKELWETAARQDTLRGFFSGTPDLLSGKFGDLAQTARGADAAELSKLGKFGLNSAGHLLGVAGVGLDGLDTANAIREGETGDALRSGVKTALGIASFAPPPVGVTCMVISGAWAAVELIPGASDAIDATFDGIGNWAEDTTKNIGDGVKDFFGW
ncbi:hypothetical protein [Arthrobacter sp. Leaf337]|uniref:hypothetical protein n=1 Tax=Arthrobacter sp. Leaf337 TaxID=1736342 RepID=UPI0009EC421A|nr:hypothetical protein [Arthrobacter sp. Leaf337]